MWALLNDRKFLHATALLVGTMVGVGIYGVPFAFAKSGFLVGTVWLVAMAAAVILFNLLFAQLTLSTPGVHQVAGYASAWLGPWGKRLMTLANVLTIYGGLLAYMIVAGEFMHNVLSRIVAVDPSYYSYGFALLWSFLWVARLRTIATIELGLIAVYGCIIILLTAGALPRIDAANLTGWAPSSWYLPYGVLLFAFSGITAIPLQRQLLGGRERLMRPAIITGVCFAAVLYALFAFAIVGLSGEATSPEALAGLYGLVGAPIILLGSILGVLTITTSYVMMGTAVWETFHVDYKVRTPVAWALALGPPMLLFASGLRNFIDVIGLIGAVAIGVQTVLLLAAYLRARAHPARTPELTIRIPRIVVWLLMALLGFGAVHELFLR
jgi:amino acid permease